MTDAALRLDCLGSGFAFSSGAYWSGFLLNGRILLDCPPQALVHLYRLGRSAADVDLVLLSHAHTDHIGGMDHLLLDAVYRQKEVRGKPFAVAGPPGVGVGTSPPGAGNQAGSESSAGLLVRLV